MAMTATVSSLIVRVKVLKIGDCQNFTRCELGVRKEDTKMHNATMNKKVALP